MRTLLAVIVAVFSTSAHAQQCSWLADSGDKLLPIDATDWDYSYARTSGEPVNCVTVRSEVETTLSCADGTEGEMFVTTLESAGVDADVLSFDYQIFARHCV